MNTDESVIIFCLIIAIVIIIIIISKIHKGIEDKMYSKFKDLEKNSSFIAKVSNIKQEIDIINQNKFFELIEERKKYYVNDAIRRSGSVSKGKVIEHFAPFLVSDDLNPNEIIFMGSPIDLISFSNIDNNKELSIDFLEIKSGNATLNKKQRLIRNAIFNQRVFYKKVMLK